MRAFDIYLFQFEKLAAKRDELAAAVEEADEADCEAWKWYEALTDEEYRACKAEAEARVNDTHEKYKRLKGQLEAIEEAITNANRLYEQMEFLEEEGVL